jgi:SAM-dependent methyltransferase
MPLPIPPTEKRSFKRIKAHYQIEKGLAARLRTASKEERRHLYQTLYDELYRRVPDHPQLEARRNTHLRRQEVAARLRLLQKYLQPNAVYLEIGPGDCALALEVARRVSRAYAVDVSKEISAGVVLMGNLELLVSDGSSIPIDEGIIDLAYSDQLMEHLHPDDAAEQLANIYRALADGGAYVCLTPNRWTGPHDVSRYFDDEARGFHLREYTVTELADLFRAIGFRRLRVLVGTGGLHVAVPVALARSVEAFLSRLPRGFARGVARRLPWRLILGVKLVGRK